MNDTECVDFLRWLLPRLHFRWAGFRRVRGQVCKRFRRRFSELGLTGADAYRDYLRQHPDEMSVADFLCRVTISRFNRDRGVFAYLGDTVLTELCAHARARGRSELTAWSAGCASGEEPYTLALVWHFRVARCRPAIGFRILGTDIDEVVLERARQARYAPGSLNDLPRCWVASAFDVSPDGGHCRLKDEISRYVRFHKHDLREGPPSGKFDLVLCRNLAFTYFDQPLQCAVAAGVHRALREGGMLVIGQHEKLPEAVNGFTSLSDTHRVYRRDNSGADKTHGSRPLC